MVKSICQKKCVFFWFHNYGEHLQWRCWSLSELGRVVRLAWHIHQTTREWKVNCFKKVSENQETFKVIWLDQ